jgi:hypothetical protein
MAVWRIIFIVALNLVWLANPGSVAHAQFGFGVGSWGEHFGSWFEIWPRARYHNRYTSPRKTKSPDLGNGHLEGHVSILPVSQPGVASPPAQNIFSNMTISAQPYGSNQWVETHLDTQGYYRLDLPPGGYNVTLHHPFSEEVGKAVYQIIIQPGKINRRDFELKIPIQ